MFTHHKANHNRNGNGTGLRIHLDYALPYASSDIGDALADGWFWSMIGNAIWSTIAHTGAFAAGRPACRRS
jgi:hypothetical protein